MSTNSWRTVLGLLIGLGLSILPLAAADNRAREERAKEERSSAAEETPYSTELNTPLVGDYTAPIGLNPILIEGVGLVTGLRGTGGDPAPSMYRTVLFEEMKRLGVRNPNAWLQSPNTALVLVRAYLPPTMKPGETLDAEVVIPESADATSLTGGWLMETLLREYATAGGQLLDGHVFAKAKGPILVPAAIADPNRRDGLLRRGRVLGGVTVVRKRELSMYLRNEFRSIRNSTRIAEAIGKRFHHFDEHGSKLPMAKAMTDQRLVLEIHPTYKHNYLRYMQVIRHIAFRETALNQRLRMQRLHDELLVAEKSERAALELEAIGKEAIPILKAGLKSPLLECRFHAAMALAYLDEPAAIDVLAEAAREERAFRVFALAGLSTLDHASAHLALRSLMNEPSAETRYGAFRALWTLDRRDPFIRGVEMGVDEDALEAGKKKNLGTWMLHVLDTRSDPMVHCTLRTRPEVVLFGAQQELSTPVALTVGPRIMVTAKTGDSSLSVVRFETQKPDERREISLKLTDLLETVDDLGATYPEVVQMLAQADRQRNLPGRLETDALPESGRFYTRPATESSPARKAKIGQEHLSPNLFPRFEEAPAVDSEAQPSRETSEKSHATKGNGMASIPEDKKPVEDKRSWWNLWGRTRKAD
jgi:hypothetical protein